MSRNNQAKSYVLRGEEGRAKAIRFFQKMKFEQPILLTVSFWKKKRTLNQNSLLWMWYREIADETGNDIDDLHHFFRQKFIGSSVVTIAGEQHEVPISSTTLSTVDMSEYLEKIEAFAASELGIMLTQPNQ